MSDNQREFVGIFVSSMYIFQMGMIHPAIGLLSLIAGIVFLFDIKND